MSNYDTGEYGWCGRRGVDLRMGGGGWGGEGEEEGGGCILGYTMSNNTTESLLCTLSFSHMLSWLYISTARWKSPPAFSR